MGGWVGGGWGWVGNHAPTHPHTYAPTHPRTHTPIAPWVDAPMRSKSPEHGTGFSKTLPGTKIESEPVTLSPALGGESVTGERWVDLL